MNNNLRRIVLVVGGIFFLHSHLVSAINIRDAVVGTIETNPDVLYSIKGWLASEQGIRKAQGGYFPRIDVVAEFGEQHSKNEDTNFIYKNYTASGAGISLRQLVFDGFATSNLIASNKGHTLAAKYQAIGAANDAALLASKAYLDVLTTSKVLSLAETNYTAMQNIANIARHKKNRADISLAQGRVALAKADLLAAENNYTNAKTVYYKIVGTEPMNLVAPNELHDKNLPQSRDQAIKDALAMHPMLKSAEAGIIEALAQYKGSKANYYPHIEAVLRANAEHDMDGVRGTQVGEEAMLQVSYNIFHGGSDDANRKQAGYLVGQAQKARDIVYTKVIENAKLSWDELNTSLHQIDYLKQHRDAASASASAYYRDYKASDLRSLVDVLDTQTESYKSEVSYVEGRSNALFSKYWLLNSEGRLLAFFRISTDVSSPASLINTRASEVTAKVQAVDNKVEKPVVKESKKLPPVSPIVTAENPAPAKVTPAAVAPAAPAVSVKPAAGPAPYKITDTRISNKAMGKYTIQLYSTDAKEDAIDFIIKNHIQDRGAFYMTKAADKNKYIVVYGSYVDQGAATLAIKAMSKDLQAHEPSVRQLSQVQAEVAV